MIGHRFQCSNAKYQKENAQKPWSVPFRPLHSQTLVPSTQLNKDILEVNHHLPSLVASQHGWETVGPPACQVEEDIHSSLIWATPPSETFCCLGNHPSCRGKEKTLVLASQPPLQLGHSHVTQAHQSDASTHFPASLAAELQPPCDPGSPIRRCLTRLPGREERGRSRLSGPGPFIPHTWRPRNRLLFGETQRQLVSAVLS